MRNNRKRAAAKDSPPPSSALSKPPQSIHQQQLQKQPANGNTKSCTGLPQLKNEQRNFGALEIECATDGQAGRKKAEDAIAFNQTSLIGQQMVAGNGQKEMEMASKLNSEQYGGIRPQMANEFSLSWRVEWSGTFPVGKVTTECIAKRLDALLGSSANGSSTQLQPLKHRLAGTRALLIISSHQGIVARAEDNSKVSFLSHPIHKVCCVIGRAETRQLAYITREQPSHTGNDIPYRKQCHVFRTETSFEVEEIESVLSSAFQSALTQECQKFPLQMLNSPSPKLHLATASVRDFATSPMVDINSSPMKTPKKVKIAKLKNAKIQEKPCGFLERSRSQMRISSSSLIQKIFGGTPKKQQKSPEFLKPALTPRNGGNGVRFRKPRWPLTPLRSYNSTTMATTPKVPVAASSTTAFAHPAVVSSMLPCQNTATMMQNDGFFLPNTPKMHIIKTADEEHCDSTSELVFDERLKEWIYPLDERMLTDLEKLAYFCRPNERDYVMEQLRRMPVGHFMIRLSGSRRKCLALTVKVEENEANPKGIAHYLLIRNASGFRIRGSKRYFQSLPMLITHHSVLSEQLPCRLQLSDWRWTRESTTRRRQSSGGSTLAALRARDECPKSPLDTTMIRWRRGLPAAENQHRQIEPRTMSSTMFSSKSSTILSA